MKRLVVLPYGIDATDGLTRADEVLGGVLGRDLADRLAVYGALDVELVDPLSPQEGVVAFSYQRDVAQRVSSNLAAQLDLDAVVFGQLVVSPHDVTLVIEVFDADEDVLFTWHGSEACDDVLALNLEAARALHAVFGVEPSAREQERLELVQASSLDALRCFALAAALRLEPGHEAEDQRLRLLESTVRADPQFVAGVTELSRELGRRGRHDEALGVLEAYLEARGEDVDALVVAAEQALLAGESDRASVLAGRAIASDAFSVRAHQLLGEALFDCDRVEEAAFVLRSALWHLPQERTLSRMLARAHLLLGAAEEATELLQNLAERGAPTVDELVTLAEAHEALGDLDAAASVRAQVVARCPEDRRSRVDEARLHLIRGLPGHAIATLCEAPPVGGDGRCYLAAALLLLDEPTGAELVDLTVPIARAVELELGGRLHLALERALFVGEVQNAALLLDRWESLAPPRGLARTLGAIWRFVLALLRGELERGERAFWSLTPSGQRAASRRLEWCIARAVRQSQWDLAERALAFGAVVRPDDIGTIVRAAEIRYAQGDRERAAAWIGPLLDTQPSPDAALFAARTLLDTGRLVQARGLLEDLGQRAGGADAGDYAALRAWLAAEEDDAAGFAHFVAAAVAASASSWGVRLMEQALESHPELRGPAFTLLPTNADWPLPAPARAAIVRLALAVHDVERAERWLGDTSDWEVSSELAFASGLVAEVRGELEHLRSAWRRALALAPDDAEILAHLGAAELVSGASHASIRLLERAFLRDARGTTIVGALRDAVAMVLS